ncbi:WecB/TagA/CpsF family glycosyltransferase [Vibrio maerlii]|uniref:WecB/TagA/CpsF family glycosyltransferase n=1 Tax=Vibrio maerlii TaxID=2231648 RepID=UPI000E3ED8A6|nr:WecB/TagA/CpsF family glycosyltransferase [Vibrio maerlii]
MKNIIFANTRFDFINVEQLIDNIIGNNKKPTLVVTPNVDHIIRLNKNEDLKNLYLRANYSVNDSRFLFKIMSFFSLNLPTPIPGSELTCSIMKRLDIDTNNQITIIGSSSSTVSIIKDKFKNINIKHYNPPMGFINDSKEVKRCIDFIIDSNSDICFLCVGSPQQEILANKALDFGATGSFLCVGASMLFLSGEEKRAPLIFRHLSMEWLYRLVQSPKRLYRRYLIDGWYIFYLIFRELIIIKQSEASKIGGEHE